MPAEPGLKLEETVANIAFGNEHCLPSEEANGFSARSAMWKVLWLSLILIALQGAGFLVCGLSHNAWLWSQGMQSIASILAIACAGLAFRRANGFAKPFWLLFCFALALWGAANGFFLWRSYHGYSGWLASAFDFMYRAYGVPLLLLLLIRDDYQFWRDDWLPTLDILQVGIAICALYGGLFSVVIKHGAEGTVTYLASPSFSNWENGFLIAAAALRLLCTRKEAIRALLKRLLVFLTSYGVIAGAGNYLDVHGNDTARAYFDLCWTVPYAVAALAACTWRPIKESDANGNSVDSSFGRVLNRNLVWAQVICLPVLASYFTRQWYAIGTGAICVSIALYAVRLSLTQYRQSTTLRTLLDREEKYRIFFEQNLAGNYFCTSEDVILGCNPAFLHMFGFASEEEVKGANFASLYASSEERGRFLQELKQQGRLECYGKEYRRRDGSPLYATENAIGIFDESGELGEIHGFLMDETKHRETEQRLQQAQKMEAVGQLAGGVAHDFNNILSIINGHSELLLSNPQIEEATRHRVEQILQSGRRAAGLTHQLLAFSRKQLLQPRILSLNTVIEGIEKMLRRLIGDDIEIKTALSPDLALVKADLSQMEQVIINFCINARDAMPDGGRITIETANWEVDEIPAAQQFMRPGHYVRLAVSDTGTGIDKETLARIFEPFFTTKGSAKGTGLGLATVYGIVKQSGGYVWANSNAGQGSTFVVCLPSMPGQEPLNEKEAKLPGVARGSETILLVEDASPVRAVIREFLEASGYTVLEAKDGEGAIEIAGNYQGKISLLLTDISLPKIKGPALAQHLLQQRSAMKVLYMSGYADRMTIPDGVLPTSMAFLQKPFTRMELAVKLCEVLQCSAAHEPERVTETERTSD
jgi:PAS domain S-box-containing protein